MITTPSHPQEYAFWLQQKKRELHEARQEVASVYRWYHDFTRQEQSSWIQAKAREGLFRGPSICKQIEALKAYAKYLQTGE